MIRQQNVRKLHDDTPDLIDNTSTPSVTYIGYSRPGETLISDAAWAIQKIDESTGVAYTYPDGEFEYNYKWSERTTLTYEMRKF